MSAEAQVYPGDTDNSGRVDQRDILYTGYAYGSVGPSRLVTGTAFMEMPIPLPWAQEFPDGTGFAFADANGDGQIGLPDLFAVIANFGSSHATPLEVDYPEPIPGADPQIRLSPNAIPVPLTAGSAISIDVDLEYPEGGVQEVNGLAYTIRFNKNYIQSIGLQFSPQWLGGTQSSFRFQAIDPQQTDELDIATTRYGNAPFPAQGRVGQLSIVIEDDLITFMEADSTEVLIEIAEVMLADDSLSLLPVNTDSVVLTVYNPNFLITRQQEAPGSLGLRCFPNPNSDGTVFLSAPEPLEAVTVTNAYGEAVEHFVLNGKRTARITIGKGAPAAGVYFLHARAAGNLSATRKIVVIAGPH